MWKCPSCGRQFKNTNQVHSCHVHSLDHHLWNRPPAIVALYHIFSEMACSIGDVEVVPMKGTILFRGDSVFCSLYVGRSFLRVHFQLARAIDPQAGWRVTEVSSGRFVYQVKITDPEALDDGFRLLLTEAATLSGVETAK